MDSVRKEKYALIGMGDFGSQLAVTLAKKGIEVLAIDSSMEHLEEIKDVVERTVCLDATEEKALESQAVEEFDAAIICIGDEFEETLLIVTVLRNLGVKRIIARATTTRHAYILRHLDIEEVILPAVDAAYRLANKLSLQDQFNRLELSSDYEITEIRAPSKFIGRKVGDIRFREEYQVVLITIKRIETQPHFWGLATRDVERFIGIPQPESVIEKDDILLLFGNRKAFEHLLSDPESSFPPPGEEG
ncbi:TrkA family potassium uptake protein [Prosthecochloris sp. N3]|uniref:TrkA family potassium uptake protein n=1 Tax=Prosthecochloris ethylica TaxID=2743976 RepID=A0ABR9XNH1_9CHLB|nr:TrkA family potassium uptake protein [Prosthecochloris ethylica]MBF0585658.1 TrkA family potassium uptake protein [Prosthecochloris ethylica]MBF0635568.1 TrkA family potassium uptake protein [Prosthecochloris ethylica]NUK46867.1 TrkA family potassium uptake protein [Prosthecochloris ethylica]